MLSKSITNFVVTFPVLFKRSFGTQVYSGLELGFSTRKTDNFWGGPQNGNTGKIKKGRVARGEEEVRHNTVWWHIQVFNSWTSDFTRYEIKISFNMKFESMHSS